MNILWVLPYCPVTSRSCHPVGACIVDKASNRILSVGYMVFPLAVPMMNFHGGDTLIQVSLCGAELNAISNNRSASFEGNKIYTTLFPCNECTKAIIQAGIKEIIYLSDKYADTDSVKASKRMLQEAGVKIRQFKSDLKSLTLSFLPEPPKNS